MRYQLMVAMGLAAVVEAHGAAMHEVAKKAERPAGAPEYADVCFRYGWTRSEGPASVENAKKAIRAFHATRVDWFYPGSHTADPGADYVRPAAKAFIDWCHANGMKVGGAINNNTTHEEWGVRKTHNSRYNGDPANPAFVAAVVAWGKAQIDAGIDALVCDDMFHYNAEQSWLFSDKVIAAIKAYKPGFSIAGNDGSSWDTSYVKNYAFHFHYSDSNFLKWKPTPGRWWVASKDHRKEGSAFLIHPNRPMTKAMRRKAISLGYASGAHVITPWDEWVSGAPRLFADPADFADLYGFVRALGQYGLLNGYEDAAVGGFELTENRYGSTLPIVVTGGSGKLSVFGRAKPGEADTPVVLHLVEWGEPNTATLRLRVPALFGTSKVSCFLLTPPPYVEATHNVSADSESYKSLATATKIEPSVENEVLVFALPPLQPWGTLVISRPSN